MIAERMDAAGKALLDAAPSGSQVVLFGSYARGTAHAGRELDFLVIEPEVADSVNETFQRRKAMEAVFGDIVQPVDIVVTGRNHFHRPRTTSPIPSHSRRQREGACMGEAEKEGNGYDCPT